MQLERSRRHLLDRPQRLGVLPTLWFWNDEQRHRLVLPLVLLMSLPFTPLLFYLVVRFQLSLWLLPVVTVVWPFLVMGLVERHIRRALLRRALIEHDVIAEKAPTADHPAVMLRSRRMSLALAALSAVGTVLAAAALWGGALTALLVLAVTPSLVGAMLLSSRLASLKPEADAPLALPPEPPRPRTPRSERAA